MGNAIYNAPVVAFGVEASEINFPSGNVDYTKVHDEVVAIDRFGASAPGDLVLAKLGINPEHVVAVANELLAKEE